MSQFDCKRIIDSACRCGHEIDLETAKLIWLEYSCAGGDKWTNLPDDDELDNIIDNILYELMDDYDIDDVGDVPMEFSDERLGIDDRDKWARRYDDLNGAPEGDFDY